MSARLPHPFYMCDYYGCYKPNDRPHHSGTYEDQEKHYFDNYYEGIYGDHLVNKHHNYD